MFKNQFSVETVQTFYLILMSHLKALSMIGKIVFGDTLESRLLKKDRGKLKDQTFKVKCEK